MVLELAPEPNRRSEQPRRLLWQHNSSLAQDENFAPPPPPVGVGFATDVLRGQVEWRNSGIRVLSGGGPEHMLDAIYGKPVVVDELVEVEGGIVAVQSHTYSVSAYAVRHMALWVVLLGVAMVWSILTGISFADQNYWLNPATGVFGCLAIICTGLGLASAGRSRRA